MATGHSVGLSYVVERPERNHMWRCYVTGVCQRHWTAERWHRLHVLSLNSAINASLWLNPPPQWKSITLTDFSSWIQRPWYIMSQTTNGESPLLLLCHSCHSHGNCCRCNCSYCYGWCEMNVAIVPVRTGVRLVNSNGTQCGNYPAGDIKEIYVNVEHMSSLHSFKSSCSLEISVCERCADLHKSLVTHNEAASRHKDISMFVNLSAIFGVFHWHILILYDQLIATS